MEFRFQGGANKKRESEKWKANKNDYKEKRHNKKMYEKRKNMSI
jgi:hypothetical protein